MIIKNNLVQSLRKKHEFSSFYNQYHKKNTNVQQQIIRDDNYTYQSIISLINKHFSSPAKVLDVGCGVGTIDFYLAHNGFAVTGVDISNRAIGLAKASNKHLNFKKVKFIVKDLSRIKFKNNQYDYAICSEVIEHIEDDLSLLKNISSSLKKSSIMILSTPLNSAPLYKAGFLRSFDKQVGHLRRYDEKSLRKILKVSGFEIKSVVYTEGLIRNSLYTLKPLGFFVRFIRWPIIGLVNMLDNLSIKLFGASNIYIVAIKC